MWVIVSSCRTSKYHLDTFRPASLYLSFQYRLMLADKLLSNLDYDSDREVRNLELLKLRFGDASMKLCEVMVKDLGDSRRINNAIAKQLKMESSGEPGAAEEAEAKAADDTTAEGIMKDDRDNFNLDATIVSRQFWPTLQGDNVQLHARVQQQVDAFSKE